MKEVLWDFRYVIAVGVMLIMYCICEWQKTKDTVHSLMLAAKQAAKDGFLNSGKEQEDWVVSMIIKLLPKPASFFISESSIRKLVQYFYGKAKDYLDDGIFNNSHLKPK